MISMNSALLFAIVSLFLGLGSVAWAQNPDQNTPLKQRDRSEVQVKTVTGCLTKGTTAGEYMVTHPKSGEKVSFAGSTRLNKYVNQTVTVSGKMSGQRAERLSNRKRWTPSLHLAKLLVKANPYIHFGFVRALLAQPNPLSWFVGVEERT